MWLSAFDSLVPSARFHPFNGRKSNRAFSPGRLFPFLGPTFPTTETFPLSGCLIFFLHRGLARRSETISAVTPGRALSPLGFTDRRSLR